MHRLSVYVTIVPLGTRAVTVRQGRVVDSENSSFVIGRGTYIQIAKIARIRATVTNTLALR